MYNSSPKCSPVSADAAVSVVSSAEEKRWPTTAGDAKLGSSEELAEDFGFNCWNEAIAMIAQRVKPHNFDMWLRPISCKSVDADMIQLEAPNQYIKEWFEDNYLPIVLQELRAKTQRTYRVHFEIIPAALIPEQSTEAASGANSASADRVSSGVSASSVNSAQSSDGNSASAGSEAVCFAERYCFDAFVVGPSNQLAHAAAAAVAEQPASRYNPLFIYGGVGLGKTHLLCAIGQEIQRNRRNARIVYLSSERFMNDYINHLRANRMEAFRTHYRNHCDVLLMDDIQFIAGKDRTQDEFFHTFNSLYDDRRQIVLTSDRYPHEIPDLEDRLRTRFQWGLVADIQQPDLETRVAILKKKADAENIILSNDIAFYLATHISSNVRELEGSLIRLAAVASLQHTEITIELAEKTLTTLSSRNDSHISIESIQREVAAHFKLRVSDLRGAKRHKAIARPRQVAMFLARELTNSSFPEIGQRFGGKDHSTVINACKKIKELQDIDIGIHSSIDALRRKLRS